MPEKILAVKIGQWLGPIIPAIVGSAISLHISGKDLSWTARFLTFIFGVFVASYFGGALVDYFKVDRSTMIDEAVILVWGIFGIAICTELYRQVPAIVRDLVEWARHKIRGK